MVIVCVLVSNFKVLLCDEVISVLDLVMICFIFELLKDINCCLGLMILLIIYEMDVVKCICDCVVVISNGELIE